MGALTDEWYYLGANLNVTGTLGLGERPIVLRPPGYPFFIAATLRLFTGTPRRLTEAYMDRAVQAVYLGQSSLLALSAPLLYLWLSRFLRSGVAFAAALLFALNPYCIVLTGLLHSDVLHMFLLIAGCLVLHHALDRPTLESRRLFAAGLVWGLVTLVRPVTLVFPGFVLATLLVTTGFAVRRAVRGTAVFSLGLCLAIAPWTARNYAVTGRFILVNVQAWAALWGSTERVLGIHPNHYNWYQLGSGITSVFSRVTGEREYSYPTYVRFNLELEEAFKQEALQNLREKPGVYLRNVLDRLAAFNLLINSVLLKVFQYIQRPGAQVQSAWFEVGNPQDFHPSTVSTAFSLFMGVLTTLAAGGAWMAFSRKLTAALVPGLVYLCFCLAHSLVFMDLLYYYLKVPFIYVLAFLFVDGLRGRRLRLPAGRHVPLDAALITLLALADLALAAAIL